MPRYRSSKWTRKVTSSLRTYSLTRAQTRTSQTHPVTFINALDKTDLTDRAGAVSSPIVLLAKKS